MNNKEINPTIKFDRNDLKEICEAIRNTANYSQLEIGLAANASPFEVNIAYNEALSEISASNYEIASAIKYLADTIKNTFTKNNK
jgi:hypothetical protein